MKRFKKILKITGITLLVLIFIVIITISPVTKYLLEKYDLELTGREIVMEGCFVNPFTGVIRLEGLEIRESKSDTIFFEAENVTANFAMLKLLSSTYEISSLILDKPQGKIIQQKDGLNFKDLILKFTPDEVEDELSESVHFNLLNFKILDGKFNYIEEETDVNFLVKEVNIESEGLRWDNDIVSVNFSFLSGQKSGSVSGKTKIDLHNLDYNFMVKIDSFDLEIINQYLNELTNYGEISALLDADIKSKGNFNSADSISAKGTLAIRDFHFGKNKTEDFASFEELFVSAKMLNPKEFLYDFDSIILNKPFVRYEMYDELDNIQMMFGKGGSKVSAINADQNKFNLVIEVVKLAEQLARNVLRSEYKLDRLAIKNGDFQFVDYTVGDMFTATANPFFLVADSINKKDNRIDVQINSGFEPYGHFNVYLSIDPKDSSYFDINYGILDVPLSMFNPYAIAYTSFPFDRGTADVTGKWNVRDGRINSTNHILLIDPRISGRVKNKDSKWLPMPFMMALLREKGNVIDYEIPITGNLKDPNFKISDAITDLLKNIFVKPASIPYRMEVKSTEQKLEKSVSLSWAMRESEFSSSQEKSLLAMVDFLKEKPNAKIVISPKLYTLKERELTLLFEAKKRFYLAKQQITPASFSKSDSMHVVKMSIKDKGFLNFLNKNVQNKRLFTVQQKSAVLIKGSFIDLKLSQINASRKAAFLALFKKHSVENQVIFHADKSVIPYNGHSFYEISYNGNFPDYLKIAFEKMDAFNDENPREKYKENRKGK